MSCLKPIYILDAAYKAQNFSLLEHMHKLQKGSRSWHQFNSMLHKMQVPCGKCINCLIAIKNSWLYRIDCETRTSHASFFFTLTYDDLIAAPPPKGVEKRHAQNFMKYLRANIPEEYGRVRFYLVGEYGGTYRRPHYHVLLWFPDKIVSKEWVTSKVVASWHHGNVKDGFVEELSASYCCKDMLKIDDPDLYKACENGYLNFPFRLFSRRPGIGGLMIERYKDYYSKRDPYNATVHTKSGKKMPLPRYFRDKVFPEREWNEVQSKQYQDKIKQKQVRDYNTALSAWRSLYGSSDGFEDWYYSNDGEELKNQLRRNTKSKL